MNDFAPLYKLSGGFFLYVIGPLLFLITKRGIFLKPLFPNLIVHFLIYSVTALLIIALFQLSQLFLRLIKSTAVVTVIRSVFIMHLFSLMGYADVFDNHTISCRFRLAENDDELGIPHHITTIKKIWIQSSRKSICMLWRKKYTQNHGMIIRYALRQHR